jgi:hypothetical protein
VLRLAIEWNLWSAGYAAPGDSASCLKPAASKCSYIAAYHVNGKITRALASSGSSERLKDVWCDHGPMHEDAVACSKLKQESESPKLSETGCRKQRLVDSCHKEEP